jgi:hypothetical protein
MVRDFQFEFNGFNFRGRMGFSFGFLCKKYILASIFYRSERTNVFSVFF